MLCKRSARNKQKPEVTTTSLMTKKTNRKGKKNEVEGETNFFENEAFVDRVDENDVTSWRWRREYRSQTFKIMVVVALITTIVWNKTHVIIWIQIALQNNKNVNVLQPRLNAFKREKWQPYSEPIKIWGEFFVRGNPAQIILAQWCQVHTNKRAESNWLQSN